MQVCYQRGFPIYCHLILKERIVVKFLAGAAASSGVSSPPRFGIKVEILSTSVGVEG